MLVYIHSLVACTFFCTWRVYSHICTFSCVCTYTHGSSHVKIAHVSYLSISPSLFHVSPVFAVPVRSLRDHSRHHVLVHLLAKLSRPESAGHAKLRTCIEEFGYLAKSDANTGYEPNEIDKIAFVDNDTMLPDDPDFDEISDFSKNTRENTGLFGDLTMFETSVSHVSHGDFALQIKTGNRLLDREREKKREKREERGERKEVVL